MRVEGALANDPDISSNPALSKPLATAAEANSFAYQKP